MDKKYPQERPPAPVRPETTREYTEDDRERLGKPFAEILQRRDGTVASIPGEQTAWLGNLRIARIDIQEYANFNPEAMMRGVQKGEKTIYSIMEVDPATRTNVSFIAFDSGRIMGPKGSGVDCALFNKVKAAITAAFNTEGKVDAQEAASLKKEFFNSKPGFFDNKCESGKGR